MIFPEYVDGGEASHKESIRGVICQVQLTHDMVQAAGTVLSESKVNAVWAKLRNTLVEISHHNPDFIIFPEISIPPQLEAPIRRWCQKLDCIIVAGSHYYDDLDAGEVTISRSPIHFPGQAGPMYTEKEVISPFEKSPIEGDSVVPGAKRLIFRHTKIGDFAVLICADALSESTLANVLDEQLDFLFVISCTPEGSRFHSILGAACKNSNDGIYICYANLLWNGHGNGKSAAFAVLDRAYTYKLRAGKITDLEPEQKIWEARSNNDFFVGEFNLARKKPPLSKAVEDEPNVKILETRSVLRGGSSKRRTRGDYRVVAFDLDGTLLRNIEFSWVALWRHCGDDIKWRDYLRSYRKGELTYQQWCDAAVSFFRAHGLTLQDIRDLVASECSLTGNFEEGMKRLKGLGYRAYIISGGIDVFLEAAIPNYSDYFEGVYINKLLFEGSGLISGVQATSYDFEGKAQALERICGNLDISERQCIYVGDTFNDESALARAGYSIVYADREKDPATLTANHTIFSDDFEVLVDHVLSITNPELFAKATKELGG